MNLGVFPESVQAQQALTDKLLRYLALLAKWNRTYNLTAVREPDQMLVQHIFDSAAVAVPLRERIEAKRQAAHGGTDRLRIVDVGSGAGLPGIVLALLWPDVDFILVEPVAKKAAFLQQAVSELALTNVTVARTRIEELSTQGRAPDAIVCRAFASIADYVRAVDALAGPDTLVAAMKAKLGDDEKSALTQDWRIDDEVALQVPELDAQRSLVVLARVPSAPAAQRDRVNRTDPSPPSVAKARTEEQEQERRE